MGINSKVNPRELREQLLSTYKIKLEELGWNNEGDITTLRHRYNDAVILNHGHQFGLDIQLPKDELKEKVVREMKKRLDENGYRTTDNIRDIIQSYQKHLAE
eukprot:TRINITY_DN1988_c0_g1_i1.p1 TRINITY_DN1988_c0_g1~~TRINITY_DN1988_c0_g1_i1.p1  ORF type:complete len:102 (-),score=18.87 TRINITY_DN1988_c0_g1_i1:562-867(-)